MSFKVYRENQLRWYKAVHGVICDNINQRITNDTIKREKVGVRKRNEFLQWRLACNEYGRGNLDQALTIFEELIYLIDVDNINIFGSNNIIGAEVANQYRHVIGQNHFFIT